MFFYGKKIISYLLWESVTKYMNNSVNIEAPKLILEPKPIVLAVIYFLQNIAPDYGIRFPTCATTLKAFRSNSQNGT